MNKKIILSLIALSAIIILMLVQKTKNNDSTLPQPIFMSNNLTIESPYAYATAKEAKTAAAFMVIKNNSKIKGKLINVKSEIAEITEIHQNIIDPDDGKMMMRKIPALNILPKSTVILDPKGYHIMFINLKTPLTIGKSFPLNLIFSDSGEITTTVNVVPSGQNPHTHH